MKRIYEFSEFNAMRLNNDTTPQAIAVVDPSLSFDPYSSHLFNGAEANKRLIDIAKGIMTNNDFMNLLANDRNKLLSIVNLKLLRLNFKSDINVDLYISFDYNDETYFGLIKNYNTYNPQITSEFFTLYNRLFTKEFKIKFDGIILKIFKDWFKIKKDEYKCLKSVSIVNTVSGDNTELPIGATIEVVGSSTTEIFLLYNGNRCKIIGKNYYLFNYYFTSNI